MKTKAIVIIDMPESCDYCRLHRISTGDGTVSNRCCGVIQKGADKLIKDEDVASKPKWCPLKPLNHETIKDIDVQMFLEELKNESNIGN